jgi:hypothetical protein
MPPQDSALVSLARLRLNYLSRSTFVYAKSACHASNDQRRKMPAEAACIRGHAKRKHGHFPKGQFDHGKIAGTILTACHKMTGVELFAWALGGDGAHAQPASPAAFGYRR